MIYHRNREVCHIFLVAHSRSILAWMGLCLSPERVWKISFRGQSFGRKDKLGWFLSKENGKKSQKPSRNPDICIHKWAWGFTLASSFARNRGMKFYNRASPACVGYAFRRMDRRMSPLGLHRGRPSGHVLHLLLDLVLHLA